MEVAKMRTELDDCELTRIVSVQVLAEVELTRLRHKSSCLSSSSSEKNSPLIDRSSLAVGVFSVL